MAYQRYTIHPEPATNLATHPNRFQVRVSRIGLAKLLLRELLQTRGDMRVVTSRPCMYGVFSGPVGGFAPQPEHCVGCLRCTVQYPDMVEVRPNPDRLTLGDSYFTPDMVDTVIYEASTGHVPVRGAGYGGAFGGPGWDGMWTDMSEIVRPTRDGIHGREFISTSVDLGSRPTLIQFDGEGKPAMQSSRWVSLPIPMLLELPVPDNRLARTLQTAAMALETRLVLPLDQALTAGLDGRALVPIVKPEQLGRLAELTHGPDMVELTQWDPKIAGQLREAYPHLTLGMRSTFDEVDPARLVGEGVDFLHLAADHHGGTAQGFVLDAIRRVHNELVAAGLRERVSLIGGGGIAAAEHVPKAIICGLDAVVLETPLLVALQYAFVGEVCDRTQVQITPVSFPETWGRQRIINLIGSWRDQMLEILGAMGLREVRRLRGEIGRAMFMVELEREAFAGIEGFGGQSDG
jgi:hypothetical protein